MVSARYQQTGTPSMLDNTYRIQRDNVTANIYSGTKQALSSETSRWCKRRPHINRVYNLLSAKFDGNSSDNANQFWSRHPAMKWALLWLTRDTHIASEWGVRMQPASQSEGLINRNHPSLPACIYLFPYRTRYTVPNFALQLHTARRLIWLPLHTMCIS